MRTYKRLPIKLVKGKGSWVWDEKGNKYLDAIAGIATCSLGHSDKTLRKALIGQLKKIQHVSNLFEIPEQEDLAKWLTNNSCAKSVFFCNSGAEANEAAIKLARKYGHVKRGIDKPIIVSAKGSFHGRTLATLCATGQEKYQKGFGPLMEGFEYFNFNDEKSFDKLHKLIDENGPRISAVLIEPIQGEGGIYEGNKKFFQHLRDTCTKNKILLILDEVQTGMGRTGKLWGYEQLEIIPDAFTLAKGLGGGHAIGALLVTENSDVFEPGDHASTFGGNPFACKAGLTVAKEIERRNLLEKTRLRGAQLKEGLVRLVETYPTQLKEVRGLGLMQGLILKEDAKISSQEIVKEAIKKGLLIGSAGERVIRLVPPLVITKQEINKVVEKIEQTLKQII